MSDSGVHSHPVSGSGDSSVYLPASVIVAALIVAASVFLVGADISRQVAGLTLNIDGTENPTANTDSGTDNQTPAAVNTGAFAGLTGQELIDALVEQGTTIGNKNAKKQVIMFSDFSCPWCGVASGKNVELVNQVKAQMNPNLIPPLPVIIDEYVKTGKATFTMVYFPGHGTGDEAHVVGWCVYDQNSDLFLSYHDEAFANQDITGNLDEMKKLAVKIGADSSKLNSCISSNKYNSRFNDETLAGRTLGVKGTPAFFIDDQPIRNWQDIEGIKAMLNS